MARKKNNSTFSPALLHLLVMVLAVGILLPAEQAVAEVQVQQSFLYKLSDFDGPVAFKTARIEVDNQRQEIYVADTRRGEVRIFNDNGMEVYRFGDDGSIGSLIDIAVTETGDILILGQTGHHATLTRCDFKGRMQGKISLQNLPPQFAAIRPNQLTIRNDQLYLLDAMDLKLVATDLNGVFRNGYDIASLIGVEDKKRANTEIGGFSVDPNGNILFTIPVMFSAFRLSPAGEIRSFGSPGSAPGRFGVIKGIAADAQGYTFVADRLKSVVLIFDRDFNFQTEFGYRGRRPQNLISPGDIDLDAEGRLYVSQLGNRGVSVFKITHP